MIKLGFSGAGFVSENKSYVSIGRGGKIIFDGNATIAEGLGISPQNLNGRLKAKSLKTDFVAQIRAVIDSYASSLSTEMEGDVMDSNVNGSNNMAGQSSVDLALQRETEVLRKQNEFQQKLIEAQQKQIATLLALAGKNIINN